MYMNVLARAAQLGMTYDVFLYQMRRAGIDAKTALDIINYCTDPDELDGDTYRKLAKVLKLNCAHRPAGPAPVKVRYVKPENVEKMLLEQYGDKYRWEQTRTKRNNTSELSESSFLGHHIHGPKRAR